MLKVVCTQWRSDKQYGSSWFKRKKRKSCAKSERSKVSQGESDIDIFHGHIQVQQIDYFSATFICTISAASLIFSAAAVMG